MKRVRFLFGLVILFTAALFSSCDLITGMSGGNTAKNTAAISGKALYSNEADNSGITVCIESSNGLTTATLARAAGSTNETLSISSTTTKEDGSYSFTGVAAGTYTVYAISQDSSEKAVKTNITVEAGRTASVADLILTPTGNISGKILLDNTETDNFGVTVFIPGTSYSGITASNGSFVISGVPAGTYSLAIQKGYFTYLWLNGGLVVSKGETKDAGSLTTVTSEDVILGYKDGTDGEDGVSLNWLGSFEDESSITNPAKNDAYYDTTDGCSYIYDGEKWTILVNDGKNASDSTIYEDIDNQYNIECYATERGIKFITKILRDTKTNATVTFTFIEEKSGITMNREWTKESNWSSCESYYPFVDAGKKYTFTIKAAESDYTLYKKTVSIIAVGGLGEFKIENTDDYDVTLTDDRVIEFTGTPEFTDNENVNILNRWTYCELYQADNDEWNWIFDQNNSSKTVLDLKDYSNWKSFDKIDASMSGHKYRVTARTNITVAGYRDNGQTYFTMNDYSAVTGDWGGTIVKVPVMFDCYDWPGLISDSYDDKKDEYFLVDYNSNLYEPTEVLIYKGAASSEFVGWEVEYENSFSYGTGEDVYKYYYNTTTSTFPVNITPALKDDEEDFVKLDGVAYKAYVILNPKINLKFNVTLMDGDTELGDSVITTSTAYFSGSLSFSYVPAKENYTLEGYYTDKDCTNMLMDFCQLTNNMKIYTKWE